MEVSHCLAPLLVILGLVLSSLGIYGSVKMIQACEDHRRKFSIQVFSVSTFCMYFIVIIAASNNIKLVPCGKTVTKVINTTPLAIACNCEK